MQKKIFIAKDIVKQFGNYTALNHVNLEIPEESIFGLLGPNGAGKTTLMRIINQIIAPDSGSLIFDGNKLKREDIAKIGYLPEERGLYKKMKVGEQALYLAKLKGMSHNEAIEKQKELDDLYIASRKYQDINDQLNSLQNEMDFRTNELDMELRNLNKNVDILNNKINHTDLLLKDKKKSLTNNKVDLDQLNKLPHLISAERI